jgi:hypothetical protein
VRGRERERESIYRSRPVGVESSVLCAGLLKRLGLIEF